ncbi:MAG TPA: glycine zipper domain-containing protein [Verrucomicrobiae bacterium]
MRKAVQTGIISCTVLGLVGCSNLPGNDQQQGAVIGGATGAAVGAAVSKENRALGAVIGGAVGAAGGYVIGKNKDKITGNEDDDNEIERAAEQAQTAPATPEQARTATTADVNTDGFVTLDEVVALEQAQLSDDEILSRLRATDQVFDLTEEQRWYLLDKGVSQNVVDQLATLNQNLKDTARQPNDSVISTRPRGSI